MKSPNCVDIVLDFEKQKELKRCLDSINEKVKAIESLMGTSQLAAVMEPSDGNVPSLEAIRISVITVVLNDKLGLKRTIDSVRRLQYSDLEYIVIDGGSTDGSRELVEENLGLVDIFQSEKDDGIYDAMNKAINLCTGEYVIFMNAGDEFHDSSILSKLFKPRIGNHISSLPDVLYGHRIYIRASGSSKFDVSRPIELVHRRMPYCHQACFIKLPVLKRFRFDLAYKFAADYNQAVLMFRGGCSFEMVDEVVCNFYSGGKSESGLRPYLEVLKIQLENFDKSLIPESEYLKGFVANFETLVGSYSHE